MSLLEQNITKKKLINELFLKLKPKFNASKNNEYKIETIRDSIVYAKKAEKHLLSFYYLISWKGYLEKKST